MGVESAAHRKQIPCYFPEQLRIACVHKGSKKENFRTGKNSQLFSLSREFGELCVDQPESKHIP